MVVLLNGVDDRLSFIVAETVVVFSYFLDMVAAQVVGFADGCRVVSRLVRKNIFERGIRGVRQIAVTVVAVESSHDVSVL